MVARTVLAAALLGSASPVLATKSCTSDYASLSVGDTCVTTFEQMNKGTHQMKPSQSSVGYAWVVKQMNDHFHSTSSSEKWFGKSSHTFPVVAWNDSFYLTDKHHHSVAIQLTGSSKIFALDMRLTVVADFRGMSESEFWSTMEANRFTFLQQADETYDALLTRISPSELPSNFEMTNFKDNVWRSLSAYASHTDDDPVRADGDIRCFVKECDAWFIEFEWAHVFTQAMYYDSSLWEGSEAFKAKLEKMPIRPAVSAVDEQAWWDLGAELLPLCHSESIRGYPLPDGFPSSTLDGWSTTPLPADPTCAAESTVV